MLTERPAHPAAASASRQRMHRDGEVPRGEVLAQVVAVLIARGPRLDAVGGVDARVAPVDPPAGGARHPAREHVGSSCGVLMPARPARSPSPTARISSIRTVGGDVRRRLRRAGGAGRARSGFSGSVGRTFWLTLAVTTAMYGQEDRGGAEDPRVPPVGRDDDHEDEAQGSDPHHDEIPLRARAGIVARRARQRRGRSGPTGTLHGASRLRRVRRSRSPGARASRAAASRR